MVIGLSEVRSVIIRVITKLEDLPAGVRFNLFIASMIVDRIGRREVLSPINRKIPILEWSCFERKGKLALKTDKVVSDNKLFDSNLVSELVDKRSFLNQSQSRKL